MSDETPTFIEWLKMFPEVTGFDWRWALFDLCLIALVFYFSRKKRR